MNKIMWLSLMNEDNIIPILHCVDERGEHVDGFNLMLFRDSRRLEFIPGVGEDGGFELNCIGKVKHKLIGGRK